MNGTTPIIAVTLNSQYMSARDDRLIGPVCTITAPVAQTIAVDYLTTVATPSAQNSVALNAASVQVIV